MSGSIHLPEDGINRYRIMHPDKDLRPLAKRLNRYAAVTSSSTSASTQPEDADIDNEREMIRLEALKWKMQVERMLGSVNTLNRQRETYIKRAEQTVSKTEVLRQTLEEEKTLLETRRRERDRMIKCDEVAAKVTARGRNRQELDERIATLQQTLEEHKAALRLYQETAEGRVSIFNQITDLVKDCRDLKLPIDPNATIPVEDETEKTETEESTTAGSSNTLTSTAGSSTTNPKLSSMALPFQPGGPSSSGSRGPSNISRGVKSRSATPPTSASLPARPPPGPSAASSSRIPSAPSSSSNRSNANLPARPSQLRSSTTSNMGGGSLEEGELGGDEDGEVKERGIKRALEPERASRSTRSRK